MTTIFSFLLAEETFILYMSILFATIYCIRIQNDAGARIFSVRPHSYCPIYLRTRRKNAPADATNEAAI